MITVFKIINFLSLPVHASSHLILPTSLGERQDTILILWVWLLRHREACISPTVSCLGRCGLCGVRTDSPEPDRRVLWTEVNWGLLNMNWGKFFWVTERTWIHSGTHLSKGFSSSWSPQQGLDWSQLDLDNRKFFHWGSSLAFPWEADRYLLPIWPLGFPRSKRARY